jgi:hypothetical protein
MIATVTAHSNDAHGKHSKRTKQKGAGHARAAEKSVSLAESGCPESGKVVFLSKPCKEGGSSSGSSVLLLHASPPAGACSGWEVTEGAAAAGGGGARTGGMCHTHGALLACWRAALRRCFSLRSRRAVFCTILPPPRPCSGAQVPAASSRAHISQIHRSCEVQVKGLRGFGLPGFLAVAADAVTELARRYDVELCVEVTGKALPSTRPLLLLEMDGMRFVGCCPPALNPKVLAQKLLLELGTVYREKTQLQQGMGDPKVARLLEQEDAAVQASVAEELRQTPPSLASSPHKEDKTTLAKEAATRPTAVDR